ncbi:hypothetical protein [Planctobacterium marinum]|uniref:Uncharacterized protein n=1 Tax=Planctobacterium marinum TaxID=1631968 RepID=A0AA48KV03_9ALTE|nr:hypothetical protein MACH26_25160 [Planctobacterium marinum]
MKKQLLGLLVLAALGGNQVLAEGVVFAQQQAGLNSPSEQTHQQENAQQRNVQTFTLNLWAPDEVPPEEAKLAEVGDSYHYLYSPDSLTFDEEDSNRVVQFRFHDDVKHRYQFRWITAENPQDVTLTKKTHKKINLALDDGEISGSTYFEVWVYDTQTGQRFMCDPEIIVGRPPIPKYE